jgi:hypothetical protein
MAQAMLEGAGGPWTEANMHRNHLRMLSRIVDPNLLGTPGNMLSEERCDSLPELRRLLEERIHLTMIEGGHVMARAEPYDEGSTVRSEVERLLPYVNLIMIVEEVERCIFADRKTIRDQIQVHNDMWGQEGRVAPVEVIQDIPLEELFPSSGVELDSVPNPLQVYLEGELQHAIVNADLLAMATQLCDVLTERARSWKSAVTRTRRILERSEAYSLVFYMPVEAKEEFEAGVYEVILGLFQSTRTTVLIPHDDGINCTVMFQGQRTPRTRTIDTVRTWEPRRATMYFKIPSRVFLPGVSTSEETGSLFRVVATPVMRSIHFGCIDDFYRDFTPMVMKHTFPEDQKLLAFYDWADQKTALYRATAPFLDEFNAWYFRRFKSMKMDIATRPEQEAVPVPGFGGAGGIPMERYSRWRHHSTFSQMPAD